MFSLTLNNARCFETAGPARVAPLTILVGENSSGKSSFLALQRVVLEVIGGNFKPNFNREPFFLGAYDQVAFRAVHSKVSSFRITSITQIKDKQDTLDAELCMEFEKVGSQPSLSRVEFSCAKYGFRIRTVDHGKIELIFPSGAYALPSYFSAMLYGGMHRSLVDSAILNLAADPGLKVFEKFKDLDRDALGEDVRRLADLWKAAHQELYLTPYAIAPVRTKPRRTYDPIDDTPTPDGDHIPLVLAKMKFGEKRRWERVSSALHDFGKTSGLFKEVTAKTLGKTDSDPFQIMVRIAGGQSNLIDVGYGVSQVLPIIVDLVDRVQPQMFLLQQPEVHLHPRGQAAIGTFLCDFVKNSKNHVTVETHSDHLIDRVRQHVREGRGIEPDDVSILYFEKVGRGSVIHQLRLDRNGNILDAPPSYRRFFLEEENWTLGF